MESVKAKPENADIPLWSKEHPSWGKRPRIQRNYYAFMVAMVMTGGQMICPACGGTLDLDTAEVDRAIPSLDYRPGNVTYICHGCNHGRGILQSVGADWGKVNQYRIDIARASREVRVPSVTEARQWWDARPTVATVSRYA